jgi:hypothetical protein
VIRTTAMLSAAIALCAANPVLAQDRPAVSTSITLKAATPIRVITSAPLSSKTSAKGERVALEIAEDVIVDGRTLITKGTAVIGEISDARVKAMFGQSGKLSVRPLYLRLGTQIVRLSGENGIKAKTSGGAVVGLALVSPLFTGRSAIIPAGTEIPASIERDVAINLPVQ